MGRCGSIRASPSSRLRDAAGATTGEGQGRVSDVGRRAARCLCACRARPELPHPCLPLSVPEWTRPLTATVETKVPRRGDGEHAFPLDLQADHGEARVLSQRRVRVSGSQTLALPAEAPSAHSLCFSVSAFSRNSVSLLCTHLNHGCPDWRGRPRFPEGRRLSPPARRLPTSTRPSRAGGRR